MSKNLAFGNPPVPHIFQPGQVDLATRILVADDDAEIRLLNAVLLTSAGYEVDTAQDGHAAWEAILAGSYNLLITDLNMPRLTGIELLNKLQAADKTLPAILLSGSIHGLELQQHPWPEPLVTLCKPYTTADLLVRVRDLLLPGEETPEPNPGGNQQPTTQPTVSAVQRASYDPPDASPQAPKTLYVRTPDHLTADNCNAFDCQVRASLNGHHSIELDLSATRFMDCAGLGKLISMGKFVRARQGVLRVMNPLPAVRQLFALVASRQPFEIGDTKSDKGPSRLA